MDEQQRRITRTSWFPALIMAVAVLLSSAGAVSADPQLQQRFSGILLLESQCGQSLPAMAYALELYSLNYTLVTTWAELDQELNTGTAYGLVMINSYGDEPTAGELTTLNTYLVGGQDVFVIFAQHSVPAGLRAHPLWNTLGITVLNDLAAPGDVSVVNAVSTSIFDTPYMLRQFLDTDTAACPPHGQEVTERSGAQALAVFDADSSRAAIVLNAQENALYHAFMPADFTGDATGDTLLDVIQLYMNELIFFGSRGNPQVTAIYTGDPVDTLPSTGARLQVLVLGGSSPTTGQFIYQFGGQQGFAGGGVLPMTVNQTQSSVLEIDVPTSILTARGLEFYFRVVSGGSVTLSGSPDAPFIGVIDFTVGRPAPRALPLPNGVYRIVSVPVDIVGTNTVDAVIVDDLDNPEGGKQWRLFSYDPGLDSNVEYGTRPLPNVTETQSYWLAARGGRTYSAEGYTRRPNRFENGRLYYEVTMDVGWNLLANPLPFPVDWDSVLLEFGNVIQSGHPDSLLRDVIYQWLGGTYSTTQRVDSWLGFFVEVRRPNVKALFRYSASTAPGAAPHNPWLADASSHDDWSIELRLETDQFHDGENFVGVRADATAAADWYDYPDPPAGPVGVQLSVRLPEGTDRRPHRTDFRAPFNESETWHLEFSQSQARRLVVSGLRQLPGGLQAVLVLDRGQVHDIQDGVPVPIPDDARGGRLVIGTSEATEQERAGVRPTAYALLPNFPNPFNPRTTIRFALPESGPVRVDIYDVLGRQVRTLTNGHYTAGTHDLVWDGRDQDGRDAGSGVYFYRIDATSFSDRRKMLLLK